ncbi:ABC transporter ATP-binding protein [Microlunatus elymi]|uniref:ABC transporter ATP-binding protein n=1 Tax=Microlunatus elymi TaxID=2596828 RepID=A0A516Q3D1_9ACTN|nr:ABC transporter ATP-binding protein [Microlunatus elymi]QDP97937.1 ABC transporter ATP-binding protein [Microlunatus elymi]
MNGSTGIERLDLSTGFDLSDDYDGPLLQVSGLRTEIRLRHATVHAVDGVDFEVMPGETVGIVGESGCGKTMTAISIMRLLPPGGHVVGGSILLQGRDLLTLTEEQMRSVRGDAIGMVFQDPLAALNPTIKIGDQIAEGVLLHRPVSHHQARLRAAEVLDLVGIAQARDRLDDYPHQFSGGMRQRVMIAMALACEPRLLIADEPTTALDVTIQAQILKLIDDLRRQLDMAVILVTHDLGVIAGRADRVVVMYAGRVVETTDTLTLFGNARHPYTEALFNALPEHAASAGGRLRTIPGIPPDLTDPPAACRFAARCPRAQDDCRAIDPPLITERPGHSFACLHPVGDPELIRPTGLKPLRLAEDSPAPTKIKISELDVADKLDSGVPIGRPLVQVANLVKDFPVRHGLFGRQVGAVSAVAGVNLEIIRGQTFGLVGESGCGKTTTGRLIVGLEEPTAGTALIDGIDLFRLRGKDRRRYRRRVQFMFQDPYSSLDPRMRVGAILREPMIIQGVGSPRQQRARVADLLADVGLPHNALDRYPHEFSGGQRQRLGLARALALQPKLIVADEPVSALDVSIQAQVLNRMRDLQSGLGLTYLIISHDLSVIRYMSDLIGVMYLGKLVEVGPAGDVYDHPLHPYTHGLITTIPVADPWSERSKEHQLVAGEPPSAVNPPSGCRFRTRCPLAQEVCAAVEPPLIELRPGGHKVACHFPLEGKVPESIAQKVTEPTAQSVPEPVEGPDPI